MGPQPEQHDACQRCVQDAETIVKRDEMVEAHRSEFVHRGVNYAECVKYTLLPHLLPR